MFEKRRQIPAWLAGLIVAVIVFAVGFVVLSTLGFGDDPVVGQGLVGIAGLRLTARARSGPSARGEWGLYSSRPGLDSMRP